MKYSIIILISFFSFSCAKEVSSNETSLTPSTNPVVEVPSDENSGTLKISFANHATLNEPDDQLTFKYLEEHLLLTFPDDISSITFLSSLYKPNLTILVNNIPVCTYVWDFVSYKKSNSCHATIDLTPNHRITVINIPKSQTITLTFPYQR